MTFIPLGRFGRPHGIRGWLRFWPFNPDSPLLTAGRRVLIGQEASDASRHEIVAIRDDSKGLVVKISGIDDRSAAEPFVNQRWFEERAAFPALKDDEIYFVDLIGLEVQTEAGEVIGAVVDVLESGSGDLLVIKDGRRQHLVPNVPAFIPKIDLDAGRVIIRPIEGLLEGR